MPAASSTAPCELKEGEAGVVQGHFAHVAGKPCLSVELSLKPGRAELSCDVG